MISKAARLACGLLIAAYLCMLAARVLSAEPPKREPTPSDWVGWALSDLVQVNELDRPFIRYLAIPPWGDEKWVPAINFALNSAVSHASTIRPVTVIANGWMIRVDLRQLVPKPEQLLRTTQVWDGLALQDPYLHVPDQNTNLKVAVIAPTIPQDQAALLANLSISTGGVYRADWFLRQALSTLDGGVYYEFRQIPEKSDKNSQFNAYLTSRGVFVQSTREAGGERRVAMADSSVTGKPRRADFGYGLNGGLWSITRDVVDGNITADKHPLRNLVEFKDDGREVFVTLPTGLIEYTLFNGQDELVREAPPDLVHDYNVPAPNTKRLQPARSCIFCHNIEKAEGWREVTNDVKLAIESGRFDVLADVAKLKKTREEVIDELAGFYAMDVDAADNLLGRARRDYSAAISRCVPVGIRFEADKSLVAQVSNVLQNIIYSYDYDRIDRRRAARELGFSFPDDFKGDPLAEILAPFNPGVEVDAVASYLLSGVKLTRTSFEPIYQDLLRQVKKP